MLSEDGFTGLIPVNDLVESETLRLDGFRSGRPSLDQFLQEDCGDQHRDHLSHTSLLFHIDFAGLVGYITLTNDAIGMSTSEVGELGLNYPVNFSFYPAIKICRLAVHEQLQNQGIGRRLLDLAVGEIVGADSVTTARLLITDAINDPDVIRFYEKGGFQKSFWAADQVTKGRKSSVRATIKMVRDIYA